MGKGGEIAISTKIIVVCKLFEFRSVKFVVWEMVKLHPGFTVNEMINDKAETPLDYSQ